MRVFQKPKLSNCQNSYDASFTMCILPAISLIPLGIALCVISGLLLSLLPIGFLVPKWCRNIIQEPKDEQGEAPTSQKRQFTHLTVCLVVISTIGLALQATAIFFHRLQMDMMIYLAISWAIATLLICITRPSTAPASLLFLYTSILISHSIIFFNGRPEITPQDTPLS